MRKILNFGSINIDYVYGVDHFVQPGETVSSNSMEVFPGGKGLNQSIALARAGALVYHAGRVAPSGQSFIDFMASSGVDTRYIDQGAKETGHAIIQVDKAGQNCILLHSGGNYEIATSFIDQVLSCFSEGDLLVLQNEINNMSYLITQGAERGMEIVLNPSPINGLVKELPLDQVTWFLLNEIEGFEITGEQEPLAIMKAMLRLYPKSKVVLTLGGDGSFYGDKNTLVEQGIFPVEAVDTTAAGDTFTGYFLQSIAADGDVKKALRTASIASAIAVSRKGAAVSIPTAQEVRDWTLSYSKGE